MIESNSDKKFYVDFFTNEKMYYTLNKDKVTGLLYARLSGRKFAGCYGHGINEHQAVISLKIRVKQLRFPNVL